ncbi:hypothetical protein [Blastococcus sp. CCUG 61487]|uniref:flavodoxin n=1 Tax=Blastococcus sp. CCUG 61487 TaxID=1840703 RepID=UPI001BB0BAB7|nr:hypothetical protein [Blastococcus sp. CCUG 61487]
MPAPATALDRRAFLRTALTIATGAVAGAGLAGCSTATPRTTSTAPSTQPTEADSTVPGTNVLLAYFSRAGENYHYGGRRRLSVGNTEVLANLIRRHLDCDVYRIEAADPYSEDYDDTVARNVREQDADARPAIAHPLPAVGQYDTVLVGEPDLERARTDDHVHVR